MQIILVLLMSLMNLSWAAQPYNWYLCYSTRTHNVYVPTKNQCIVAKGPTGTRAVRLCMRGETVVKMLPKVTYYECWTGPGAELIDTKCMTLDLDWDGEITLHDYSMALEEMK